MHAEGWYVDPWRIHEERWFSDGRPTALVRDGTAEGNDPPPDGPVPEPLEEVHHGTAANGSDLRRVGEEQPPITPHGEVDSVMGDFIG